MLLKMLFLQYSLENYTVKSEQFDQLIEKILQLVTPKRIHLFVIY